MSKQQVFLLLSRWFLARMRRSEIGRPGHACLVNHALGLGITSVLLFLSYGLFCNYTYTASIVSGGENTFPPSLIRHLQQTPQKIIRFGFEAHAKFLHSLFVYVSHSCPRVAEIWPGQPGRSLWSIFTESAQTVSKDKQNFLSQNSGWLQNSMRPSRKFSWLLIPLALTRKQDCIVCLKRNCKSKTIRRVYENKLATGHQSSANISSASIEPSVSSPASTPSISPSESSSLPLSRGASTWALGLVGSFDNPGILAVTGARATSTFW